MDLIKAYQESQFPPETLDVDDWADKYRFMNEKTGEKWITKRVAVARGPMKAVTEPGVRTITVMTCTQLLKALDVDTPIPTHTGFKLMRDIETGDCVFDEKGNPCFVVGVSEIKQAEKCFEITFSDGAKITCDAGHKWLVDDNMGRNTTQKTHVLDTLFMSQNFKNGKRNNYAVSVAGVLKTKTNLNLPIPPYTLGVWLGDGHSYSTHITKHEKDEEIFQRVRNDGFTLVEKDRRENGTVTFHFSNGERLHSILNKMGLLKGGNKSNVGNHKHIPREYLRASEEQRWSLLQGLMDTDGTIDEKLCRPSFTTIVESLADDFCELVCSLGMKPKKRQFSLKDGYRYFTIDFMAYEDQPIFSLSRKRNRLSSREGRRESETTRRRIVNIEEVAPRLVKCIAVDSSSHLYLAGKNFIPTHNTELILNAVGYFVHMDPCPMLAVYPKEGAAKKFSHTRLKQMLKSTPVLRNLVTETKQRDSADTTLYKEFPGGFISIVSSRNPDDLAALPIRVVVLDEIDKFEDSSGTKHGGEGDPVDLAEERMSRYSTNCLSIRACSPTIKNLSKIEASYNSSDQRKPYIPCPHCQKKQILFWGQVLWDKNESGKALPETARYYCTGCGVGWTEAERLRALQSLNDIQLWRQTAKFTCCGTEHEPGTWDADKDSLWDARGRAKCPTCSKHAPNRHAGFWANKLYSPFRPLSDMVRKWVLAQGNIEKLKMFINTQLGETFEEAGHQIDDSNFLLKRLERYQAELPHEVGVITAGIDVQDNRLEVEIVGWGADEESWSLNHIVLPGDPALPDVWIALEQELNRPYVRADGKVSFVAAACIDMQGHKTEEVLQFCRNKIERRIWAIRGIGGDGRAYPVWPHSASRSAKSSTIFYNIGVDSAKNVIFARLLLEKQGPGYCHFPIGREKDYFDQFIVERRMIKYRGTMRYYKWENISKGRNEAFDMRVYAYAALCGLQSMGLDINLIIKEQTFIMEGSFKIDSKPIESKVPEPVNQMPQPQVSQPPRQNAPVKSKVARSSYMDR